MKKRIVLLTTVIMVGIFSLNVLALVHVDMCKFIDARTGEVTRNSIMIVNPDSEKAIVTVWKEDWGTVAVNGQIIQEALETMGAVSQSMAPYSTFRRPTQCEVTGDSSIEIYHETLFPASKMGGYWTAIVVCQKPLETATITGAVSEPMTPCFILGSPSEFEVLGNSSIELHFETLFPASKIGNYWTAIVVCQESLATVAVSGVGETSVQNGLDFYSSIIRFDSQNNDLQPWIDFLSVPAEITLKNFQSAYWVEWREQFLCGLPNKK